MDQASLRPARDWLNILARYREPDPKRSIFELIITAMPFALIWLLAWAALPYGYWLTLLIALPAAGLLVRLFLIQHDCGHGAFFRRKATNDWTGRLLGIVTLTPYDVWRRAHATHHASSGNLDLRGLGDIDTLTVSEYRARPFWGRVAYRIYRNPIVLFVIGPAYLFLIQNRVPYGLMTSGPTYWLSALATNAATVVCAAAVIYFVDLGPFLMVHLPIVLVASSIGVWLFYVQHQFETTVWDSKQNWNQHEAALHGASHYDLPPVLRWFTANIGVHHVHHLYSKLPFYRLYEVVRDYPDLGEMHRLTLLESLACLRLRLWDEHSRRLVSFREARALA